MALGQQLREARQKKKQTPSQVAAATRMQVQLVEALEEENFAKIAAPIYAKGFIRLYAEHVGLDPAPLIQEYVTRFVGDKGPSLTRAAGEESRDAQEKGEAQAGETVVRDPDLFSRVTDGTTPADGDDAIAETEPEAEEEPTVSRRPKVVSDVTARSAELWQRLTDAVRSRKQVATRTWRRHKPEMPRVSFAAAPWKAMLLTFGVVIILVFVISGLSQCVRRASSHVSSRGATRGMLDLAADPPDAFLD